MRVGFVTQLLWPRYGELWVHLVQGIGGEACFADAERVSALLRDERIANIPGLAFRIAAAQALALRACDLIVAPDLNRETDIARGGGQDPWVASFPEALATSISGLPPIKAVAAQPEPGLESAATALLLSLSHDPARVRRVWEQHRHHAKPPRRAPVRWTLEPPEKKTVGLLSQPWHFSDRLLETAQPGDVHLVSQHQFDPAELREQAWRAEPRLVATDAEVVGAARLLARKGSVDSLLFVADKTSGADAWLARQLEQIVHKPLTVKYLQDITPDPVSLVM